MCASICAKPAASTISQPASSQLRANNRNDLLIPDNMTDTQDESMLGDQVKEVQTTMTNPKLRTKLSEYGQRRRTDGPYADNLECDALVVGGGFAGVFMFWSLKKEGLNVVMYEAGTDLGGTWRWNCYRELVDHPARPSILTTYSWSDGGL